MASVYHPRVSVVIGTYNCAPYIETTVESILRQTYTNLECIIIDDGSTDGTWSLLGRLGQQDARIVLHRNETNLGISRTRNLGTELARGEFIAIMDHDDISVPDRLDKQLRYLDAHPEVGVVGGAVQFLYANELGPPRVSPQSPGLIAWTMCFDIPLWHPGCMVRRDALLTVGGYDPAYAVSNDHDLWFRMSQMTGLANLSDVVLHYRRHDSSYSQQKNQQLKHETTTIVQRAFESEIGVQLTQTEVRRLVWGFYSPLVQTGKIAGVIRQLAFHIKDKYDLTPDEWKTVQQDAARRLLLVLRHRPDVVSATAALFYAFRFAPLYSVRRLISNLRNYLRRRLL